MRPKDVIVQEQLLLTLESAYPNILPVEDLARCVHNTMQSPCLFPSSP